MKNAASLSTQSSGLVYLFTGDGKGKTSAALGTAVRALGNGWKVIWIAFYKEASWGLSEYEIPGLLKKKEQSRFHMFLLGKGFYIRKPDQVLENADSSIKFASLTSGAKVIDDDTPDVHQAAALAALEKALGVLRKDRPDVLVLDEICNAISDGLLKESAVLQLLAERGNTHIVLTGRSASTELQAACDLVSEVMNRKHPYDQGKLAVKGLDY